MLKCINVVTYLCKWNGIRLWNVHTINHIFECFIEYMCSNKLTRHNYELSPFKNICTILEH